MTDVVKVEPADYRSSHKFGHSPLAEALWVVSLDSGQDDEAGNTDTIGWFALFHFNQAETIEIGLIVNDSVTVTVPRGSYILGTDDQGFVWATRYLFKSEEVRNRWAAIERDAAPTHLRLPHADKTACGEDSGKLDADIDYVDCEDCILIHEQSRYDAYR